jgi:hypothetical protein
LNATVGFLHATLRFSNDTLLTRCFGAVVRIGVCMYNVSLPFDLPIHVQPTRRLVNLKGQWVYYGFLAKMIISFKINAKAILRVEEIHCKVYLPFCMKRWCLHISINLEQRLCTFLIKRFWAFSIPKKKQGNVLLELLQCYENRLFFLDISVHKTYFPITQPPAWRSG